MSNVTETRNRAISCGLASDSLTNRIIWPIAVDPVVEALNSTLVA